MAKKKKAGTKQGKAKAAKGRGNKPAAGKPRARGPRSQPLPGMEQVRNAKLDNLCEAISETRGNINQLRTDEKGNEQAALKVMQSAEITVYRHSGVELLLVPGDVKLRVRTTKDTASTDGDNSDLGGEAGEAAGQE